MFAVDAQGHYILCNREAAGNIGMTPEQIVGKTDADIFPAAVVTANRHYYQQILATAERITYEFDLPAEMGEPQSFLHTWFPVLDAAGTPYAVCGVITNITERKRSEQALRSSEDWLRQIMNSFPDCLVVMEHGCMIDANAAASKLMGYPMEELIGKPVLELVAPEAQATVLDRMSQPDSGHYEAYLLRKDGTHFPADITSRNTNYHGRIVRVGIVRDITEQKQQEAELRRFRDIVHNTPVPISDAPVSTGQLSFINPAYCRLLGYTAEELRGMPLIQVFGEDPDYIMSLFHQCIDQGFWQGEIRYRRKDGTVFPTYLIANVLYDTDGVPHSAAGFVQDLTERKQQEAERAALQQQIIDAQQNALRELSTPLIPISDDVVIMPLIGTIDSRRAQQVLEALLEGVAHYQADLVILDITGVQIVDTQVAQAFIHAAQAVRLLGAQVMLTGIQPQIAQTLIHLGVDLQGIITYGSLQAGIAAALQRTGPGEV